MDKEEYERRQLERRKRARTRAARRSQLRALNANLSHRITRIDEQIVMYRRGIARCELELREVHAQLKDNYAEDEKMNEDDYKDADEAAEDLKNLENK